MAQEVEVKIKVATDQAVNNLDKLGNSIAKTKGSTQQLKKETESVNGGGFDKLSGSLSNVSPKFNTAISGAKAFGTQLLSLAANPIVAVIIAVVGSLTLLYKAFTSTKAGGEALERVMSGIGATVDVLRDRILNIGNAIINFFSGDFKGALSEAKKSVSGIGSEIEKEFKQAADAKRYLQEVDDALRSLGVSRAKLNRDLAKSKEIITDENASYAEKKKAINDVKTAEELQTKAELINAEKKLKAIKLANSLSDTGKEDLQKEASAQAELYALQEKSATDRRAIRKTEVRADKEEQSRIKEIATAKNEASKAQSQRETEALKIKNELIKASFDNEKLLVDEQLKNTKISIDEKRNIVLNDNKLSKADRQKYLIDLQNQEIAQEDAHNKSIADLNKRYDDEKANRLADTAVKKEELDYNRRVLEIENLANTELERQTLIEKLNGEHLVRMGIAKKTDNDKTIADAEALKKKESDIEQAKFDLKLSLWNQTASALSGLGNLFKKGTAAAKVAALAEIAIGSATGLINGLDIAQKSAKGTGPAAAFAFPLFYATQVAAVFGAVGKAKALLGTGGGGSMGGGIAAPAPAQFNVVGASGANQIAQTLAGGQQQPVQAYVVAGAVTTGQSLNRNIINNASMG